MLKLSHRANTRTNTADWSHPNQRMEKIFTKLEPQPIFEKKSPKFGTLTEITAKS